MRISSVLLSGLAAAAVLAQTPQSIDSREWSASAAEQDAYRYGATPEPGGYKAPNPGQQWMIHFDGRGFTVKPEAASWTWGLELERYGFSGEECSAGPAKPVAGRNRVRYPRGALEEWFLNDSSGLEQGFTLNQRPRGDGLLRFELAVRGGLKPRVSRDGVQFVDAAGATVLRYGGLKAWDAAGRALPAHFEASPGGLSVAVDERGAIYPVTVDPTSQQQAILPVSGDRVAISGDTMVIGTSGAAGRTFVFTRSGGVWVQQATLDATFPVSRSISAMSVSISGDTVAVGENGEVYVFTRSGGAWSQQAYLQPTTRAPDLSLTGHRFGWDVAVSGDIIAVGALSRDDSFGGWVYVFERTGSLWSQTAYFGSSSASGFGASVALSGDTLVVGSYPDYAFPTGRGSTAFVFKRSGGTWSQEAALTSPGPSFTYLGGALSISGDTILATGHRAVLTRGGSLFSIDLVGAFFFARSGGTWAQQAHFASSRQDASEAALSGDVAVIGNYRDASSATGIDGSPADTSAPESGAALVFRRSGGAWLQQSYLKASDSIANARFGAAVAIDGDTAVVVAPGRGVTYVFNTNVPGNTPPSTTPMSVIREPGTSGISHIATVRDPEDPAGSITVTAVSPNPPNGVTISAITNNNGTIWGNVAVQCGSFGGTVELRATDPGGASASGIFTLTLPPLQQMHLLSVERSGFRRNAATGRWEQLLTITMRDRLWGPFRLAFQNLTPGISLYNASGSMCYGPFLYFAQRPADQPVADGERFAIAVQFINPANLQISYQPAVFSEAAVPRIPPF